MRALLSEQVFREYRRLREANSKFTEAFVPCRPYAFGAEGRRKFVYCGVAVWEPKLQLYDADHTRAWQESQAFTQNFLDEVARGEHKRSAFWRMFDVATQVFVGEGLSLAERTKTSVWTNLSKLGEEGRVAPHDRSGKLRELDVAQLRSEIEFLEPDWMLCVSGRELQETGYAAFEECRRLEGVDIATPETELRRLPNGGVLIWTMHPGKKPLSWIHALVLDLKLVAARRAELRER